MEQQKNNIIPENQDSYEKDIIVATKHVDYNYEDHRNVISVCRFVLYSGSLPSAMKEVIRNGKYSRNY